MCSEDGHNAQLLQIKMVVSFLLIDVSKCIFFFCFRTYVVCDFHLEPFVIVFLNSPYAQAFIVHCHLCLLLGFALSLFFLSNLSAFYLSIDAICLCNYVLVSALSIIWFRFTVVPPSKPFITFFEIHATTIRLLSFV